MHSSKPDRKRSKNPEVANQSKHLPPLPYKANDGNSSQYFNFISPLCPTKQIIEFCLKSLLNFPVLALQNRTKHFEVAFMKFAFPFALENEL